MILQFGKEGSHLVLIPKSMFNLSTLQLSKKEDMTVRVLTRFFL